MVIVNSKQGRRCGQIFGRATKNVWVGQQKRGLFFSNAIQNNFNAFIYTHIVPSILEIF